MLRRILNSIWNFIKKHVLIRLLKLVTMLTFFLVIVLIASNIHFSENEDIEKFIAAMSFALGICQIDELFSIKKNPEIEEIQKQNEELKEELAEIKNMIAEQPKRYSVEIREIKD